MPPKNESLGFVERVMERVIGWMPFLSFNQQWYRNNGIYWAISKEKVWSSL